MKTSNQRENITMELRLGSLLLKGYISNVFAEVKANQLKRVELWNHEKHSKWKFQCYPKNRKQVRIQF